LFEDAFAKETAPKITTAVVKPIKNGNILLVFISTPFKPSDRQTQHICALLMGSSSQRETEFRYLFFE
jgi:hypothetical protein